MWKHCWASTGGGVCPEIRSSVPDGLFGGADGGPGTGSGWRGTNMPIQAYGGGYRLGGVRLVYYGGHGGRGETAEQELPEAKLVLQVHDELIVECPEPQAAAAAKLLEEEMEQVAHLSVPLTAEAHWGRNWLEAKGWKRSLTYDGREKSACPHRAYDGGPSG